MISVICVYNDEAALNRILIPSLQKQSVRHEFIPMNNTDSRWRSAASALNTGAARANGRYLMFVHQDVELESPDYLKAMENMLNAIPDLGIAGVIGMSPEGKTYEERLRGYISNCGQSWGKPISKPEPVQTLDECLLICPANNFEGFDELTFDHWHCYGCDYALRMNEQNKGAYAVPGFIYHRSKATNIDQLRRYHVRLFLKHHRYFPRIYATSSGLSWFNIFYIPAIPALAKLNHRLFPSWLEIAKQELQDCSSILDLGCGYNTPLQYMNLKAKLTGVEVFYPYLVESRKKALHHDYIHANLSQLDLPNKSYDAVFSSEVIEHLHHNDGLLLLNQMAKWARKKVIITTPNGWIDQNGYDDNPYQLHRSAWTPEELRRAGYHLYGMSGWKSLRKERGQLAIKPEFLGMRMAQLTGVVTRHIPELDFQLLGVKHVS